MAGADGHEPTKLGGRGEAVPGAERHRRYQSRPGHDSGARARGLVRGRRRIARLPAGRRLDGEQIGTLAAVATSFVAFLLYDVLFIEPRFTFAVADSQDWLSLLLFLVVGVVIGRLAGGQAERAAEAEAHAGEAEVSFRIGRSLAVAASVRDAATGMAEPLRAATGMERIWIATGPTTQQNGSG